MNDLTSNHQPSQVKILQQRISIITWSVTLLLSLRGLFAFYGMKEKGSTEQILMYVTDPWVQLFRFDQIEALAIPGISVLLAAISLLLLSNVLQVSLWLVELRMARARHYVFQQAPRLK